MSILGVPSSAGSHNPEQEKAPAAWRAAGLADGLRQAGLDVEDRGDLPAAPFRPVSSADGLRDVERVVAVARRVADEAHFPHFAGLTLEEVSAGLGEFAGSEKFGGLVITEVNPDHDPEGQLIRRLARVVADTLAPRQ